MRLVYVSLVLIALSACSSASTAPDRRIVQSLDFVHGVTLSVTATPVRVTSGRSIEFVASAHNATDATIQIGTECGPSMDVVLLGPRGYTASVLSLLNPGGAFTCELSLRHFAAARGSQIVRFRVAAPNARGRYQAVAGLRRSDGLGNLSGPIVFDVH